MNSLTIDVALIQAITGLTLLCYSSFYAQTVNQYWAIHNVPAASLQIKDLTTQNRMLLKHTSIIEQYFTTVINWDIYIPDKYIILEKPQKGWRTLKALSHIWKTQQTDHLGSTGLNSTKRQLLGSQLELEGCGILNSVFLRPETRVSGSVLAWKYAKRPELPHDPLLSLSPHKNLLHVLQPANSGEPKFRRAQMAEFHPDKCTLCYFSENIKTTRTTWKWKKK